jgi:hypothetical protein
MAGATVSLLGLTQKTMPFKSAAIWQVPVEKIWKPNLNKVDISIIILAKIPDV